MEQRKKKIYVLSYGDKVTGGIELCHQLVYKLRLLGFDAYICYVTTYMPGVEKKDAKSAYMKYQCPYVDGLIEDEDAIYVIAEGLGHYFSKIRAKCKVFWWLSVDYLSLELHTTEEIIEWLDCVHLVQSEYARQYAINEMNVPKDHIFWLSDYINSEYLVCDNTTEQRENIVLFNPCKGTTESATLIVNSFGKIKWQALRGMSVEEMKEAMKRAKIYIDFGNHPGKDRIPREAALQGLCILTNKKGAAQNATDVSIPEKYKFEELQTQQILSEIYELCDHYEERIDDYKPYVKKIQKEFQQFECDAYLIFSALCDLQEERLSEDELFSKLNQHVEAQDYKNAFVDMVRYRCNGYKQTREFIELEAEIRWNLSEFNEAKYLKKVAVEFESTDCE